MIYTRICPIRESALPPLIPYNQNRWSGGQKSGALTTLVLLVLATLLLSLGIGAGAVTAEDRATCWAPRTVFYSHPTSHLAKCPKPDEGPFALPDMYAPADAIVTHSKVVEILSRASTVEVLHFLNTIANHPRFEEIFARMSQLIQEVHKAHIASPLPDFISDFLKVHKNELRQMWYAYEPIGNWTKIEKTFTEKVIAHDDLPGFVVKMPACGTYSQLESLLIHFVNSHLAEQMKRQYKLGAAVTPQCYLDPESGVLVEEKLNSAKQEIAFLSESDFKEPRTQKSALVTGPVVPATSQVIRLKRSGDLTNLRMGVWLRENPMAILKFLNTIVDHPQFEEILAKLPALIQDAHKMRMASPLPDSIAHFLKLHRGEVIQLVDSSGPLANWTQIGQGFTKKVIVHDDLPGFVLKMPRFRDDPQIEMLLIHFVNRHLVEQIRRRDNLELVFIPQCYLDPDTGILVEERLHFIEGTKGDGKEEIADLSEEEVEELIAKGWVTEEVEPEPIARAKSQAMRLRQKTCLTDVRVDHWHNAGIVNTTGIPQVAFDDFDKDGRESC